MIKYWIKKLSGCQFDNFFPIDVVHSSEYEEKRCQYSFAPEIVSGLNKLSKGRELSCYILMVSALKILIHKLIGEEDTILISPAYKEKESDTEFVILRDVIKDSMSYKDVILAVKNTVTEGYTHQNYPYNEILELFDVEEDSALNNVLICSEGMHEELSEEKQRTIGISLKLCQKAEEISLLAVYNRKVYYDRTVEMLFQAVERIFEQALKKLDITVGEIEIVSQKDCEVYQAINNKSTEGSGNNTIVKGFVCAAERKPDATALVFHEQEMSYSKLNQMSNEAASKLIKYFKQKNPRVGIMVKRSFDMMIGLLGIMKSGAAYVPIDPAYPENRIRYILNNCQCDLLLVQDSLMDSIPKDFDVEILSLESLYGEQLDKSVTENIDESKPDELAYMIYTSGTTGDAKGVMVEHQAVMNTLDWWNRYYELGENACVLQLPSFSFDSSVENIFATLISGGKLVLIEEDDRFDMKVMQKIITQNKVNHILTVPSYYKLLAEHAREAVASLNSITLAGEDFDMSMVKKHMELFPDVILYNEYGPTENSVCSTVYRFTDKDEKVLIGKPVDNTECFIMRNKNVLPIGTIGELCVSGKGLAKGYYGNRSLTDKKFIECAASKYGKVYRTGDMARILPDGNIEFHGREDEQVKIRGFRIELGEVEANISQLEGIRQSIVLCVDNDLEEKELHAFIVAEQKMNVDKIKEQLKQRLPYYMVPTKIMQIETISMNANGKTDRAKLLMLEEQEEKVIDGPETELERKLVRIWSEVLKVHEEKISVTEDFSSIGGSSITSVILLDRIEREFQLTLSIADFYLDSSIRTVAAKIEQRIGED